MDRLRTTKPEHWGAMRRREFVAAVSGAAFCCSFGARAQATMRRIGVLALGNPDPVPFFDLLREGLGKLGYVEGRNIQLEIRSAGGNELALVEAAAELVRLKVDVLVAWHTPATMAARTATSEIPIVMTTGDPVGVGLVESLSRPGGNITGLDTFGAQLGGKCIELIRDTLPSVRKVAILANEIDPFTAPFLTEIDKAAVSVGISIQKVMRRPDEDFATAFSEIRGGGAGALIVQPTLLRPIVTELALVHRLPTFSNVRGLPVAGGLMAYTLNLAVQTSEMAGYVDRVLKGVRPAEIPISQPTVFVLIINLRTARALGIEIPPTLLARADEVIE